MSNISEAYEDIFTSFKSEKGVLKKIDILDIMSEHFTKKRYKALQNNYGKDSDGKISKFITETEFVKFLKDHTTSGSDYANFDYFVKFHKLELDNNGMIMFKKEFPFDNKIKKEALFIWCILNAIKNDQHLKRFINKVMISIEFQAQLTSDLFPYKHNVRYDICFRDLGVAVEIDENHVSSYSKKNDKYKTELTRLSGCHLIRLNCRDIGYLHDSYILEECIDDIKKSLLSSLLKRDPAVREYYITYLCKSDFQKQIDEHKDLYKELSNKKDSTPETINGVPNDKYDYYVDEMETTDRTIKYNTNIINAIEGRGEFKTFYEIKHKCYTSKNKYCIDFETTAGLLSINTKSGKMQLKKALRKIGIIKDSNIDTDKILISWRQLSAVIHHTDDNKGDLKDVLYELHSNIQENYEIIIKMINEYTSHIEGNPGAVTTFGTQLIKKTLSMKETMANKISGSHTNSTAQPDINLVSERMENINLHDGDSDGDHHHSNDGTAVDDNDVDDNNGGDDDDDDDDEDDDDEDEDEDEDDDDDDDINNI